MNSIVSVQNFSKSFGSASVVEELSFEVNEGEVFAFLGGNGSGKTTTIRTLLGIYQPDAGQLLINGQRYTYRQAHMLGYLPEERGLYVNSKVLETFEYFGQLKGVKKQTATKRALEYLERVGLADHQNHEIKKLSSGQQQKIQLGITILNQPQLLILDEPTKGLDPLNRQLLMELLYEMRSQKTTIMFITHQMEEVEKIADRLVMIKEGKRKLYGSVDEVKNTFGTNTIHVRFRGKFPANNQLFVTKQETNLAELQPKDGITAQQILEYLVESKLQIRKFEISQPSLHEIFIHVSSQANEK